jgi:cell division transport system ATP-binding protein
MKALITFRDADIMAGENVVVHGLNMEIAPGDLVYILGKVGSGKTSIIRTVTAENPLEKGEAEACGFSLKGLRQRDIPKLRRKLGVVFQDFRLIPTMTAYENVAFAMRVTNVAAREIRRRVPYILKLVGLEGKSQVYPEQLSGGEQQRVALARALVHNPKIILADEPTGNIDPKLSMEIIELLKEINKLGTTVVVVTHDISIVNRFKERTIILRNGRVFRDTKGAHA